MLYCILLNTTSSSIQLVACIVFVFDVLKNHKKVVIPWVWLTF